MVAENQYGITCIDPGGSRYQLYWEIICRNVKTAIMAGFHRNLSCSSIGRSGAINNIIYGVTMDPISTVYAFSQAGIGIVVGLMAYYGALKSLKGTLLTGIFGGAAAVVISTPLNIIFWGGTTGNLWGDLAYAATVAKHFPLWQASTIDEIIVDIPDKIVVLLLVAALFKGLPKSLMSLYQSNHRIESLD